MMESNPLAETAVNLVSSYLQNRSHLAQLRQQIVDHFNESELRDLAFDMKVNYDSLPGSGTADKTRELIALCLRQDKLTELVTFCLKLRPALFVPPDSAIYKNLTADSHEKASNFYATFERKLKGDSYAASTLERLADRPTSANRQAALTASLTEIIEDDPALANDLKALLQNTTDKGDVIHQEFKLSENAHMEITGDIIGKVENITDPLSREKHKKRWWQK